VIEDCLTELSTALNFWFDCRITAEFDCVDWASFGLTLTPLAGYILLLLTELLGGRFGVVLTIVDILVRATLSVDLTVDLAKLFWACNSNICTLSLH